jgi:hypothetical protein
MFTFPVLNYYRPITTSRPTTTISSTGTGTGSITGATGNMYDNNPLTSVGFNCTAANNGWVVVMAGIPAGVPVASAVVTWQGSFDNSSPGNSVLSVSTDGGSTFPFTANMTSTFSLSIPVAYITNLNVVRISVSSTGVGFTGTDTLVVSEVFITWI